MKNIILTILLTSAYIQADQKSTSKNQTNHTQATQEIDAEVLYIQYGCTSCHGFYAQGTNIGPRLQNQKEKILLHRLKDLQKGITRKPNGTVMISFARSLDENQTKAMAKYLSIIKTSYENRELYDYEGDDFGDS